MPSLGADMESGTILTWYVKPGEVVRRGAIVALVDTEKAEIEVEIWTPGRVEEILVEPGREVPVGTPLLTLSEVGGARPAATKTRTETAPAAPSHAAKSTVSIPPSSPAPAAGRERVRATPLARRLARERGIDLARLAGSGPLGRVRADDVRAMERPEARRPQGAVAAPKPSAAIAPAVEADAAVQPPSTGRATETGLSGERLRAIQRGMAAAMARSKREIPHFYLAVDVDMTKALAFLEAANRTRSVEQRLLLPVLLLKATALALRDVPDLNGHWRDDRFVPSEHVHLGVAIAVRGGGLLAPALHDVDRRDLDALMHDLSDLVARARRAQLRSSEVVDATATVTSLADRGPDRVYGVIYPPQVALVGFGTPRERPWAEGGLLGVRPVATVTLSADHRASDGQRGSRLLRRIARALDQPETLA